jgi:hypothetical protein
MNFLSPFYSVCSKKNQITKKKSQSCVKIVKLPIKKLLVFKKKVKTQQKNHKAVVKF